METKADQATAPAGAGRPASRLPFDGLTASFDGLTMLSKVEAVSIVEPS